MRENKTEKAPVTDTKHSKKLRGASDSCSADHNFVVERNDKKSVTVTITFESCYKNTTAKRCLINIRGYMDVEQSG